MLVGWQASEAAGELPKIYKVTVSSYDLATARPSKSDMYDAAFITHGSGGAKSVVISSLVKGHLIQVRVFALSPVVDYYGPAAEIIFRPISRPSAPTALTIVILRNQELAISWRPPLDSGDGTAHGVAIARYRVEYQRPDSSQWTALPEDNVLSMSILFLEKGLNYSFNCYAISQQISSEGGASFRSVARSSYFYYGQAPYWDSKRAPPPSNPPGLRGAST